MPRITLEMPLEMSPQYFTVSLILPHAVYIIVVQRQTTVIAHFSGNLSGAKKQYLLILQVSRYCLLAFYGMQYCCLSLIAWQNTHDF